VNETAYERVISALRAYGCKVAEKGGQRTDATCPAHEDHNPSLSVTGIAGQTLMHCHGGCDYRDVLAALELTPADLYDERSATYRYDDGRTVRRFYDERGKKRFAQSGAGATSTLYHLAQLEAAGPDRYVFLVEGEKDVHAIEAAGGVATTAPQGAQSFGKVDVTPLTGRLVVCVVDRDERGDEWAAHVAQKLEGVARAYRFVRAAHGKDAADHIAAGHDLNAFEDYVPPTLSTTVDSSPGDEVRARRMARIRALTYRRSELSLIAPPGWLIEGVVNRASLTLLSGKFGTYKSFVSIALAASVATGRPFLDHQVTETGPVIYIAAEGASGIRARLEAWEDAHNGGVAIPDDRFVVIGGPVKLLDGDDMAGLDELCKDIRPRMIVWDTLHRCAPGIEEDKSKDAGEAIDVLSSLRESYDCAQLVDHHTGHSGQRARGSSAWEDDFDGSWVIKLAGDGEDRSPHNQRTMEHRKVKDGELSPKIPIGLVTALESAYVDRLEVEPGGETVKGWLVNKAYAHRLDQAGVPLNYGRVKVAQALKALGIEVHDNNVAADIARLRKTPDYIPASVDVWQTQTDTSQGSV
jgi:hypothetical protein